MTEPSQRALDNFALACALTLVTIALAVVIFIAAVRTNVHPTQTQITREHQL